MRLQARQHGEGYRRSLPTLVGGTFSRLSVSGQINLRLCVIIICPMVGDSLNLVRRIALIGDQPPELFLQSVEQVGAASVD